VTNGEYEIKGADCDNTSNFAAIIRHKITRRTGTWTCTLLSADLVLVLKVSSMQEWKTIDVTADLQKKTWTSGI